MAKEDIAVDVEEIEPTPAPGSPSRRRRLGVLIGLLILSGAVAGNRWVDHLMSVDVDPGQAPPHDRPIVERDGKTLLWAKGPPDSPQAEWFDMTDALIDPRTFQYGIGKDTIVAIDRPLFMDVEDPRLGALGIHDRTIVIGHAEKGMAKAYPIFILDAHELVNDRIGGKPVTVGW